MYLYKIQFHQKLIGRKTIQLLLERKNVKIKYLPHPYTLDTMMNNWKYPTGLLSPSKILWRLVIREKDYPYYLLFPNVFVWWSWDILLPKLNSSLFSFFFLILGIRTPELQSNLNYCRVEQSTIFLYYCSTFRPLKLDSIYYPNLTSTVPIIKFNLH